MIVETVIMTIRRKMPRLCVDLSYSFGLSPVLRGWCAS